MFINFNFEQELLIINNMDTLKEVSSLNNPLIKQINELKKKSSKRKQLNLCIVEGQKEIEIALSSGLELKNLLIRKISYDSNNFIEINNNKKIICSDSIIKKLSLRESTNDYVAVFKTKNYELCDIKISDNPLVLILENIEKPGNIGAVLRTCDAVGVDLILFTEMMTDIYNPHIIRNSLGCVFTQSIIYCSNEEALKYCIDNAIELNVTYLGSPESAYNQDFKKSTALVFGNEHTGVSEFWQDKKTIKIPMNGEIDSMNISSSVAVIAFEVFRQRLT